mmetsp:Transcript_5055/g.9886  ORF Transcript_5055/g.9886 Transcript_5055/m.9886 type:complete len:574 (-) Transcript_5055:39-1760(-)
MTQDATDNEVSTVLRHFRPRPGFASSGIEHGELLTRRATGPRQRQKRHRSRDRGFSSVQFIAAPPSSPSASSSHDSRNRGGKLRLTYLHVEAPNDDRNGSSSAICVFLTFEIEVITRWVECVQCSAPCQSLTDAIKSYLDDRCNELSACYPPSTTENSFPSTFTTAASTPSLFLVTSQLLQLLNNDFPTSLFRGDAIVMKSSLSQQVVEPSPDAMIHRVAKTFVRRPKQPSPATIAALLDVQMLLVRCAAAGRNRSEICAPVPAEFANSVGRDDGDAVARLVFEASNQLYICGFHGEEQQPQQCPRRLDTAAWSLLSFFLSLPWTAGSQLTTGTVTDDSAKNSNWNDDDNGIKTSSKTRVGTLRLDIGTALGDAPPAFSRRANQYGTIQAYHGTKISSAWSILNHGLRNLSRNDALRQNGAMMGEGVYLSSSRRVAESFAIKAAERPPRALASAFRHECLLHLLCHAGVDIASLDPLDGYDIVCLPVFEATIVKPSPTATTGEEDALNNESNDNCTTRQEGKYFVCADGEFVRLTNLHLAFELSKKSNVWRWLPSRIPVSLIVLLAAMLWMVR